MRSVAIVLAALGMGAAVSAAGAERPKANAKACFERIKQLAGDWVEKDPKTGKEQVMTRFRVTAGGSAVEEIIMPGAPHEMVTVYHLDGNSLLLTHYCAVGNQPRMKATPNSTPERIEFKCAGGSGMKSHDDMHMHHAVMTFPAGDRFVAEWFAFQKGKPGAHSVKFDTTRKPAR